MLKSYFASIISEKGWIRSRICISDWWIRILETQKYADPADPEPQHYSTFPSSIQHFKWVRIQSRSRVLMTKTWRRKKCSWKISFFFSKLAISYPWASIKDVLLPSWIRIHNTAARATNQCQSEWVLMLHLSQSGKILRTTQSDRWGMPLF